MSGVGSINQAQISPLVQANKQQAEQALTGLIKEAVNNPTKNIREIQQPSPLSQFLDIKI